MAGGSRQIGWGRDLLAEAMHRGNRQRGEFVQEADEWCAKERELDILHELLVDKTFNVIIEDSEVSLFIKAAS